MSSIVILNDLCYYNVSQGNMVNARATDKSHATKDKSPNQSGQRGEGRRSGVNPKHFHISESKGFEDMNFSEVIRLNWENRLTNISIFTTNVLCFEYGGMFYIVVTSEHSSEPVVKEFETRERANAYFRGIAKKYKDAGLALKRAAR